MRQNKTPVNVLFAIGAKKCIISLIMTIPNFQLESSTFWAIAWRYYEVQISHRYY